MRAVPIAMQQIGIGQADETVRMKEMAAHALRQDLHVIEVIGTAALEHADDAQRDLSVQPILDFHATPKKKNGAVQQEPPRMQVLRGEDQSVSVNEPNK